MNRFVIALALLGSTAAAHAQESQFTAAPPILVGRGSGDVLLVDVNHDGRLDLITRHLLDSSLAVRLGDGVGHFAANPTSVMRFGFRPGAAATGDVNRDGILDLVVTNKDPDGEKVHVLLGNGSGGFAVPGATFVASAPRQAYKPMLHLVDVNEDGKLDIATANGQTNTFEILFGDGRGGLLPARVVVLDTARGLYTSAVGDVDGDGHLDIVAVSSGWSGSGPGRVVVKRGDGRGGFTDAGPPVAVLSAPRLIAVADANGDGRADVVLGQSRGDLVSVLLSQGDGRFTEMTGSPADVGGEAWGAAVADIDNDGKADLVVTVVRAAAPGEGISTVVALVGDGRRLVAAPGSPFPAGRGAYHLAAGDVNGDGWLDVVAASFEGDAVTLLLGRRTNSR